MAEVTKVTGLEQLAERLRTAFDSPVARFLRHRAEEGAELAKHEAPVSRKGSKFSPPGHLRDSIRASEVTHDDDGSLMALFGTRVNRRDGGFPYPLVFVSSPKGFVVNRGHQSVRLADDYFLERAAEKLPFEVIDRWP